MASIACRFLTIRYARWDELRRRQVGDDEKANNPNHWRGLNLLGFALMHVRRDA